MGRQITRSFNEDELRCKCGCGRMEFSDEAVGQLQLLRDAYGKPMRINSGYRCPAHNARVSSTGLDGPHTKAGADNITVDVEVFGGDALDLLFLAMQMGWTGFGLNQKGPKAGRFLHLDRLPNSPVHPRPWPWTY